MARGHQKAGSAGAFGHEGSPEAGYNVRGRSAGGKLHQAGAKKWKPEEVSPAVSKAVVVHKEKQESALEAKIVAAIARAEAMIVANRAVVAEAQFARLAAIDNITPFASAAEGVRARLVAQGVIR